MRPTSSGKLMRFLAGASLLVLAQGLLAPAAKAGCSHGVSSHAYDRFVASISHLDDLITGGAAAGQDLAPKTPPPCSGPGCSGHVPPPAGSTAVVTPPSLDHWGVLDSQAPPSSRATHGDRQEESLPLPAILSSGIFHPPRSFA
ncbi:hypothetical protein OJF2_04490 [Aquisphaera giovannonii]|uniref:Uncharacterized protein n=1 Tax=Aquisphaera giovannonii TaxID=406548 RepID=A0A5B9VUN1_9BACT|nr:hypothetical protein [Aquisphaera giovannonii]QEH31982.1 hypothetical protein OJF2_04490 [Aquisphaera giovannonii]